MLESKEPRATVAVRNFEASRQFYEGKLGLVPTGAEMPGMANYQCGGFWLLVYQSQYAGTNKATAVTWIVGEDIETIARGLTEKGVRFENYDMPDTEKNGDIYTFGKIRTAWFSDPDGNIHSLVNG